MRPLGVVFDMDGVLFDTEAIYDEAWREAAQRLHIEDIEPAILACKGVNGAFTRAYFEREYPQVDYSAFDEAASRSFEEIIEARGLPEKPGLHEILNLLRRANVPVALATSTDRERCLRHLAKSGVESHFRAIVAGDQVAHGKPAPDIYQAACAALGLNPADCVAVEDSYNGVRSAHAAGLRVAMVPDLLPATAEMRGLTWRVFDSLNEMAEELEREL
ncbi:MAG: HAD family phosphatase [Clostridia bacterium]|nr:HAD family phosphatase [Clostridia bacterium]